MVDRIRAALATIDTPLSASFGIAIGPADGEDLETLSEAADGAMYRDKGRTPRR